MTSERWQRVQELFAEAAELSSAERHRFLDSRCGGDRELRAEVDSLFAFDSGEEGLPLAEVVRDATAAMIAAESMLGKRIGPYRLARHLGTGGMGTVYLGVRDDAQFEQQVAIKVVRAGLSTFSVVERFHRERRILAQLDHPFIARLLDGGTSADGLPYLVMEYVEGTPIHRYCAAHRFTIAEKCALFVKVCEAVSYAHRNLVIHRDLKPGNIMVAEDGTPKLLDFGIAMLLTPDSGDVRLTRTGLAALPLTPDYASPEQVMGGPFNTATDVYSLGAVLYELLCGTRPHRITSVTPLALERAICLAEVPKPSAAAPKLRRDLAGDLDNILLMALRKEPQRRYQSAAEFREDLQRYLKGLPVTAREDTLLYRSGKFARRHRVGVATAAFAFLSLAAGLIAANHERNVAQEQFRIAEKHRQAADRERARAEAAQAEAASQRDAAVLAQRRAEAESQEADIQRQNAHDRLDEILNVADSTLFSIEDTLEKVPGAVEARKKLVQATLAYLDRVAAKAGDDRHTFQILEGSYVVMGDVQGYPYRPNLGDFRGAIDSYRKAAGFLARLQRQTPDDPDVLEAAVGLYQRLGETLGEIGKSAEALEDLQTGMSAADHLLAIYPKPEKSRLHVALMHHSLALFLMKTDVRSATVHAKAEQALYSQIVEANPKNVEAVNSLASSYLMMAQAEAFEGHLEEGVEYLRKAAKVREDLTAQFPEDVLIARNLLITYGRLGDNTGGPYLLRNLGDSAQAIVYYRKAVAIAERLAAVDPRDRLAKNDLATALMRLGITLDGPGQWDDSLAILRRSETLFEEMLPTADPGSTRERRPLSMVYEYLGHRLEAQGKPAEALPAYRRSVEISDALLARTPASPPDEYQLLCDHKALALLLASLGRRDEALQSAGRSVAMAEALASSKPVNNLNFRHPPSTYETTGQVYAALARSGGGSADWTQARAWFARSRDAWGKLRGNPALPPVDQDLARLDAKIAECERELSPTR